MSTSSLLTGEFCEHPGPAETVPAVDPSRVEAMFRPRSIALIGASRDPDSMSGMLLKNLVRSFDGSIYPVNPRAERMGSLKVYPGIADVPEAVDLALIAVPSRSALDAVRQCLESGARALVVITAGFGETGTEGHRMAAKLRQFASTAGVPLLGPNCLGLLNTGPANRFNATFIALEPQPGNVGVLTQSGALGFVFPDYNRRWNIGISRLVSLGNKLCLGENELLAALEHDDQTSVIQLYLESFRNPRVFREVATRISRHKPIVALKAGRTDAGQRAAGSHTAALASPAAATSALFHQSGIVAADSLEELFDTTVLLSTQPLPRGRRVAVLTNAGGPGVVCADAIESAGLQLPGFSESLQRELRRFLPAEASVHNPIDLIGSTSPEEFARCLTLLLQHDASDAVIVIYVPRIAATSDSIAAGLVETLRQHPSRQTILCVFMQHDPAPAVLNTARPPVPAWTFPESAVRSLAAAVRLNAWRQRPETSVTRPPAGFDTTRLRGLIGACSDGWLDPGMTAALLQATGMRTPGQEIVRSANEAVAAAVKIGFPVVIKAIAPGLIHRTEAGAVVVDLRDVESVHSAATRLLQSVPGCDSLLIQQYIDCDREVMVGVSRDAAFGRLIGFGRGGIDVEIAGDVQFRMHPLTDVDAAELVREHPAARFLGSHRHRPAGDIPAVVETLLRVSGLLTMWPDICEADLNPVKVLDAGQGVCVVDARIRIGKSVAAGPASGTQGAFLRSPGCSLPGGSQSGALPGRPVISG